MAFQPGQASRERLALLVEELAEAAHIAGKALRHGLDSTHADYGNVPNRDMLAKELGDVLAAMWLLRVGGDVSGAAVDAARTRKLVKIKIGAAFLHHQGRVRSRLSRQSE